MSFASNVTASGSGTAYGSWGSAGCAGSSYAAPAAVTIPGGGSGTVSVTPGAWTPQPYVDYSGPSGWVYANHGYVEVTWS